MARHVSRSCLIKRGVASNNHKYLQLKIPYSKTKLSAGDWIICTQTFDSVDCVAALEHHLVVNAVAPPDSPFFSYETAGGTHQPLTRSLFMDRCNAVWLQAGMGSLFGHGFRIGGTTHLLLRGVDPWVVMKQGRWSSKAFLIYWRNIEEILPLFIGDSLDKFQSMKNSVQRLANAS